MSQNLIQPATSFLLDALKENKQEQGHLQTCLLELNLIHAPQVADAILGNEMLTHYDRPRIANLSEKSGLLQRVISSVRYVLRVVCLYQHLRHSSTMKTWPISSMQLCTPMSFKQRWVYRKVNWIYCNWFFRLQWLVNYFSRLTTEQSMAFMQEMLCINIRQNLQIVIQIATKYSDVLGPVKLIEMFA
jgi:clathrin heavy chain